jgi:hypothetical protein
MPSIGWYIVVFVVKSGKTTFDVPSSSNKRPQND